MDCLQSCVDLGKNMTRSECILCSLSEIEIRFEYVVRHDLKDVIFSLET
jgi:hypothetical protein